MSLKYYVYVSDTKVDMLYSQIPKGIRDKIAVELGINLGMFSLNVKRKENQEKTRYEKLKLVVNYIENNMDVGTVDEPKAYFKGSLPMRWGPDRYYTHEEGGNLIYYSGETAKSILGLGGSQHHVIGKQRGTAPVYPLSPTSSGGKEIALALHAWRKELDPAYSNVSEAEAAQELLNDALSVARYWFGLKQNLEFLAKRLVDGPVFDYDVPDQPLLPPKSVHVVVGTPLYVAYAE